MNLRSFLCLLTLAALPCGSLAAEDEVDLAWGLEKGKKYSYRIETRSEVGIQIPRSGENKTVVQIQNTADLETGAVKAGNTGTASMSGKYSHTLFHLEVPQQGSAHFDSDSEMDRRDAANDPVKRGLLMLTGKVPFTFKMGRLGGVTRMKGHSRFVSRAFPPRGKEPITTACNLVLAQYLKDKSVEETFNDVFLPFPKEKPLPGDTWKGDSKGVLYPLGTYIFKSTYTLKEVKEGKTAVVTVVSEVERDPRSEPGFGFPQGEGGIGRGWVNLKDILKKMKVTSSKREGEFEFDLEKKEMVKGKVELTLELHGSFDNPWSGEPINIPLKATHKRTIERLEKKE